MAENLECDVAIVGAGLVGASLAAGLQGSGLRIVLLDAEAAVSDSALPWDARIYAISPASGAYLTRCGAWQRIAQDRIARVQGMDVYGDAEAAQLRFSAYQAGLSELCFIAENRAIQRALAAVNAHDPELRVLRGVQPTAMAMTERSASLELADGGSLEARLVVGADGAQSWVRESAGIESKAKAYGQQGVVANFETERGHRDIARQWFRSDGVLALLPLPGNRVSMVWSTWDADAERLLAMEAGDLAREVELASRHALGALNLITAPRGFPLQLIRVAEWVRPRLALIGDAAHTVHPLAGQGVNLGFQDASELVDVLRNRGVQDDCGDHRLLRRYARRRSEPVALMQATTDGLQRLFNTPSFGLKWLRNTGLQLADGIVPLKSMLVAHALG